MLVREIMTCPAFSVHRESSLNEALQLMAERKVTSLPVVGVYLVFQRHLVRAIVAGAIK